MSVVKVSPCGSLDPLKPEKKGKDFLESIMRQVMGRESSLSSSRANDSPAHWINLFESIDQIGSSKVSNDLKVHNFIGRKDKSHGFHSAESTKSIEVKETGHLLKQNKTQSNGTKSTPEEMQAFKLSEDVIAFAQAAARANNEPEKYLPGWPLLQRSKLQKCKKCSREFCSLINYRRHARVHRRSLNIDKDSPRNREHLGAFWDKLSPSEAKQIASLEDAEIKDVTGPSVIKVLSSWMRKPGFSSLPKTYLKAGISLLDVVQASSSSLPLSSHELFCILDDASEGTFLCSGTAVSLQKFVFDGEVEKIGLEMENLIACLTFMLEQKLIKAWVADKDAEALRCHKLLMEEEEAAQKRQAELMEKKRLKKLRQREQKIKELVEANNIVSSPVTTEEIPVDTRLPDTKGQSDSDSEKPKASFLQNSLLENTGSDHPGKPEMTTGEYYLREKQMQIERQEPVPAVVQLHKLSRTGSNIMGYTQIPSAKDLATMNQSNKKTTKVVTYATGHQMWTRKIKTKNEEQVLNEVGENENKKPDREEALEVLIGSITVPLESNNCGVLISPPSSCFHQQKMVNYDSKLKKDNLSIRKQWIPVRSLEKEASIVHVTGRKRQKKVTTLQNYATYIPSDEGCLLSSGVDVIKDTLAEQATADLPLPSPFSKNMDNNLLAKRWQGSIAADHVKLAFLPDTRATQCADIHEIDHSEAQPCLTGHPSTVNRQVASGGSLGLKSGALKTKFTTRLDELSQGLKYVQKQRINGPGE